MAGRGHIVGGQRADIGRSGSRQRAAGGGMARAADSGQQSMNTTQV